MTTNAGEIVLLLGASGAGKTSWWLERYERHQVLSLDTLRKYLADDVADQQVTPVAVEIRRMLLEHRAQAGLATVVDATNAVFEHRAPVLAAARRWHRPIVAVVFHTPLAVCLQRQQSPQRTRRRPGQPNGRSTPAAAVVAQYEGIARVWDRMHLEADCVVHVGPDGTFEYAVGDVPRPAGVRVPWLEGMPTLPSAAHLPWRSPYLEAVA